MLLVVVLIRMTNPALSLYQRPFYDKKIDDVSIKDLLKKALPRLKNLFRYRDAPVSIG